MANKKINQLDPFSDEKSFEAKDIRRSRMRKETNFFVNVEPVEEKKAPRWILPLACVSGFVILAAVLFLIFSASRPEGDLEVVTNPVGNELPVAETNNQNDRAEQRADELKKLESLRLAIETEDWNFANTTFDSIFPAYLDACGQRDYYSYAETLRSRIEGFALKESDISAGYDAAVEACLKLTIGQ